MMGERVTVAPHARCLPVHRQCNGRPWQLTVCKRRDISCSAYHGPKIASQGPVVAERMQCRSGERRWPAVVRAAAAALLALNLASVPVALAAESFAGVPRIIDGDTLEVDGKKVRLYGIDAPETKQSCRSAAGQQYLCGQQVTEQLKAKLGKAPVRCETKAKDQYGRRVAVCRTDSFELNRWLVDNGLAVAYRQYGTEYVLSEDAAKAAKRGIWSGAFDMPMDWRKEQRIEQLEKGLDRQSPAVDANLKRSGGKGFAPEPRRQENQPQQQQQQPQPKQQPQAQQAATGGSGQVPKCPNVLIKGNISQNNKQKIYFKPGNRSYVSVQIDQSKGERYFCSAEEAEEAGWRAAKS